MVTSPESDMPASSPSKLLLATRPHAVTDGAPSSPPAPSRNELPNRSSRPVMPLPLSPSGDQASSSGLIGQSASSPSGVPAYAPSPESPTPPTTTSVPPRAAEPVADRLYRLQPHCAAEARNPRPRHRAGVDDRPGGRAVGNLGPEGRRERERQRLAPLVMRVVQYRHRDRLRRLAGTEAQRPGHRLIVRARRRRAVGGRIAH